MADTPEAKMKKKVDKVLKEAGVWYFAPQSGIYGRSGIPDRIGILPGGRILAIEVKAGTKYGLTALQEKTLTEIRTAGGSTWVVHDEQSLTVLRTALKMDLT
jgi:hypothetical protein